MKEYEISVILPIYKIKEKYLKECIMSLLGQSIKEKIQIILIDDASPDNCGIICDQFANKYDNISVIHKIENKGVSEARNTGIEKSIGKWIMFVDPDDWVESNLCEELLKSASLDTDIIISGCNICFINQKVENHIYDAEYRQWKDNQKEQLQLEIIYSKEDKFKKGIKFNLLGVPWAKLYKSSFLKGNELKFKKNLIRMQDSIFNLECIEKAKNIKYIDICLYNYRQNCNSISNLHSDKIIDFYVEYLKELEDFLKINSKNQQFCISYNLKCAMLLNNLINQYIFYGKIKYKESKRLLKDVMKKSCFENCLNSIELTNFNKYKRIILSLVKTKKYVLIKVFIKLRVIIKSIIGKGENNYYD